MVCFREIQPNVVIALGAAVGLLLTASITVRVLKLLRPQKDFSELSLRIRTWWLMAGLFLLALALNNTGSLIFFGFVSFLALKEFLSLIPTRRADRRVLFWAYLAIPLQYYWIGLGWYGMFIAFIPVFMFLALPMRMVTIGETTGYLHAIGTIQWGLMVTVFSLSHIAYLLVLRDNGNPVAGGAGLVFFLVFLTQFNDVAQYCWGKTFGRHKVLPTVSPNKTYEGLIGGIATTMALAYFLSPHLTPLTKIESLAAGLMIGLGGFMGDAAIACFKRDLGIKDSGSILPGHGGILDRVNSLTYTGPLFFHFIYFLHY
jgi:phosphatidate cytidylyltransferase